jgi:hypothetical protein
MKLAEESKIRSFTHMTLSMVRNRGNVSQEELEAFYAVMGEQSTRDYPWVVSKQLVIMQSYANTPVDAGFQKICFGQKISKF